MPRDPEIWVLYNTGTGDIYVIKSAIKVRSLHSALRKLNKLMGKNDHLLTYEMEMFFRNHDFDKNKIHLCWNHKASDIMVWNQKFFKIRDRVL